MAFVDIILHNPVWETCHVVLLSWCYGLHEDKERTKRGDRVPA